MRDEDQNPGNFIECDPRACIVSACTSQMLLRLKLTKYQHHKLPRMMLSRTFCAMRMAQLIGAIINKEEAKCKN